MKTLPPNTIDAILAAASALKPLQEHAVKTGPLAAQDRWKAAEIRRSSARLLAALNDFMQVHDALLSIMARNGTTDAKRRSK